MHFDQTSLKTATRNSKKIPQRNEKNSSTVRENRSTGNTGPLMPAPLRDRTSVVHRIRNLESNLAGY